MLNNKLTNGVFVATGAAAAITFILVLIFMLGPTFPVEKTDLSIIDVNVSDGTETEVEFESLVFNPGTEHEYTIKLKTKKTGKYEISFDFNAEEVSALSQYVKVKILDSDNNVLYDQILQDAIDGEIFKVDCELEKNIKDNLTVVYYLESTVGNEAKNLELTIDLVISITKK